MTYGTLPRALASARGAEHGRNDEDDVDRRAHRGHPDRAPPASREPFLPRREGQERDVHQGEDDEQSIATINARS